jgi:hypothetical protein
VEKKDGNLSFPTVKDGEWLIVQFQGEREAKAVTARMQYDTGECEKCKAPEWLCKCAPEKKDGEEEVAPPASERRPGRRGRRSDGWA